MSTQAQVNAAAAAFTITQANAWKAIVDPVARESYIATLMTNAGISPIDEYVIAAGREALRAKVPVAT